VRPRARKEAVSANLGWPPQRIGRNLTKIRKEFLHEGLISLLRTGRPAVCRMAREFPDHGTEFLCRLDRLESLLNQADGLEAAIWLSPPRRVIASGLGRDAHRPGPVGHRQAPNQEDGLPGHSSRR